MAITLDTTLSGETSNSYCDIAYADDYFANHYDSAKSTAWAALSDDQKAQLLVQACAGIEMVRFTEPQEYGFPAYQLQYRRDLNQLITVADRHRPYKYSYTQALQFPRNMDYYTDGTYYIPPNILMAQCEQALYISTIDDEAVTNQLQGILKDTTVIGSGEITVSQTYSGLGVLLAPLAIQFITPYVLRSGARLSRS